jgi:hypothetical protein
LRAAAVVPARRPVLEPEQRRVPALQQARQVPAFPLMVAARWR